MTYDDESRAAVEWLESYAPFGQALRPGHSPFPPPTHRGPGYRRQMFELLDDGHGISPHMACMITSAKWTNWDERAWLEGRMKRDMNGSLLPEHRPRTLPEAAAFMGQAPRAVILDEVHNLGTIEASSVELTFGQLYPVHDVEEIIDPPGHRLWRRPLT